MNDRGLKPLAKIVGYGGHAQAPEWFTTAPVGAIKTTLERTGLAAGDIDLWEINEAFAAVPLQTMRKLGVDRDKVNINGGAMALGHPIGATGAVLINTALDELERQDKQIGLITMCAAGGMAPAIIIERV